MSDFSKFRTAVSGFNRTDVVNYIESTSIEHKKMSSVTREKLKLMLTRSYQKLKVRFRDLNKNLKLTALR